MIEDVATMPPSRQLDGESRTTAFCRQCGRAVTGRRRNGYCSDRCRMRRRRIESAERSRELLTTVEGALHQLRRELACK